MRRAAGCLQPHAARVGGARIGGMAARRWLSLMALAVAVMPGCVQPEPIIDCPQVYADARHKLREAAADAQPQVRTKAMEALADTVGAGEGPLFLEGLRDETAPVRFAAAMAVGDTRYVPAKPLLLEMIKTPQLPPKLRVAVIYALHKLGEDTYTGELARLLFEEDKWVKCTVAMALGRMHEPSAMELLRQLRWEDKDPVVQLTVHEALAELGDERAATLLEAFSKSPYMEDRIIGIQVLGRLGHRRSMPALQRMVDDSEQDPLVRVAAAGALAQMGNASGYKLALAALNAPEKMLQDYRYRRAQDVKPMDVVNLQSLAALALGKMKNRQAAAHLHPLLFVKDGTVRVAAAKATLELLADCQLRLTPMQPREGEAQSQPATQPTVTLELPAVPAPEEVPGPGPATQPGELPKPEEPATKPAEPAVLPIPEEPSTKAVEPATKPAEPTVAPAGQPAPAVQPSVPPKPAEAPAEAPATKPAETKQPATEPAPAVQEPATKPVDKLLEPKGKPKMKTSGAKD